LNNINKIIFYSNQNVQIVGFKFLYALVIFFTSCAQIVAPTGGPKDAVPPVVQKENPINKSTSFNEKKITIKFDEFIQLKDAEEQIVISPPFEEKPFIEVQGKNIMVEIRGNLKPNTTYTINFGNSITDNHEGTVIANYSYVFATGKFIDSLKIRGNIKNAFDNKVEKGLMVSLYAIDSFTDSTIIKHKPLYFTKTNESGSFSINNLPPQQFKFIVFKDDNKNLKYDKNEIIGFSDSLVNSTDSLPLNNLFSFKPNPYSINRLMDTIGRNIGFFKFAVYKPFEVKIKPLNTEKYYVWNKPGKDYIDTFTIFSKSFKTDSVWFNYKTPQQDTNFYIKPFKNAKPIKFEATIKKDLELNDTFTINFNQPLAKAFTDTSMLKLKEDSIIITPKLFYSENGDYLKLYYLLKEHTKYSLEFKDSAFADIYGTFSKKDKVNFTTKGPKDYSSLKLSFIHPKDGNQYIIQMITEDESKVFKTFIINQDEVINLEYLVPAKYRLKIIKDANKNGQWDNGDYQTKTQPEKVFYYKETLTLRAFWDLEQTIDIGLLVK
jgi:uncharacterized protein (DUF2141 family)